MNFTAGAACLQFGHSKSPYSTTVTGECSAPIEWSTGEMERQIDGAAHGPKLLARQIEDQHFCVAPVLELQLRGLAQFQCIARFQRNAVGLTAPRATWT